MQYYLHRNEKQIGPYDEPQIRGMVASGAISRSDLCWREGLADWQPLEAVFQFALPPPITIPAPISPPPLPSAKPDAQFAHPAAKKKKIGLGTKVVIGLVLLVGLWAVFKPASSPPAVSPAHPAVAVSQPPQPSPVLKQKHPSTGVAGSQAPLSSSTKSIPPTSPAPSTPPPIDISTVTASEAPKKVVLKSGEAFSVANGTGQITAPAGSVVDVVARSGDTLRLSFLGGSKDIHYSKTSFAAEVQAARERAAQIARAAKEPAEEARKADDDFRKGDTAGELVGKEWASQPDGGRPMPAGVRAIARTQSEKAKPSNEKQWQSGFEKGFTRGWDSVRGSRNEADYVLLSWKTAQPGVKMYDYNEDHIATVISAAQLTGQIIVRYAKKNSVEPKNLNAMSKIWSVKRNDPALK